MKGGRMAAQLSRGGKASRDVRDILRAAVAAGCVVTLTGGGHYRIATPGGGLVFASASPSSGARVAHNIRADLRRAGVDLASPNG